MNKKVITLTKIFLKTSFQGMEFQKQKSKNNKNSNEFCAHAWCDFRRGGKLL